MCVEETVCGLLRDIPRICVVAIKIPHKV